MTKYLSILLVLVTLLGCQEPFLGDGEDEMTFKAWSASGALVSRVPNDNITLQSNFVENPEGYTVQFSITNIEAVAGAGLPIGNYAPTAEIVWSVEGNSVRRLVSVVNGTTVSGVGQGCRVKVYDETPLSDATPQTTYIVGIQIAPGVRAATQVQPTYVPPIVDSLGSTRIGALVVQPGVGGLTPVDVPVNAGVTCVFITASKFTGTPIVLTDADVHVYHTSVSGVTNKAYNPMNYGWVPVAPETDHITFADFLAVAPGNDVIFSVTFGIDG